MSPEARKENNGGKNGLNRDVILAMLIPASDSVIRRATVGANKQNSEDRGNGLFDGIHLGQRSACAF